MKVGDEKMELIGLKKCSTCREVEKILNINNIQYTYREINIDNPNADELKKWYLKSGENSTKKLVNTSGMKYKELGLKDKWDQLDQVSQFDLLATDGMLVKRPILLTDEGDIYIGAAVKKYLATLV